MAVRSRVRDHRLRGANDDRVGGCGGEVSFSKGGGARQKLRRPKISIGTLHFYRQVRVSLLSSAILLSGIFLSAIKIRKSLRDS